MWFLLFAQAEGTAPATGPGGPGGLTGMLPMLVVFFAIMYFLIVWPSQKREKERQRLLNGLAKGDRVITMGGICGIIVGLTEKTVVLKVSDDPAVKMEFVRQAIHKVMTKADEKPEKEKK